MTTTVSVSRYVPYLIDRDSRLVLINCQISGDCIVAKLVHSDRLFTTDELIMTDGNKQEYKIRFPPELKNLSTPYTGFHEGLFEIKLIKGELPMAR